MSKALTFSLSLVLALAVITLMLLALDQAPLNVFTTLYEGSFGTPIKRADTAVVWVSLAIISSGLLITFRAGQWNIGIEGQITMGAIFAFGAGRIFWEASPILAIPAMLLWGCVGGMIWGILVSILKIYGGVNEIFGGLGLNFVTASCTIYLISGRWKPPGSSSVGATQQLPESLWLPTLAGLRISPYAILLAVVVVALVYVSLRGTIWGLQLKAVGKNPRGAYLLGVPTTRILMSAYIACGACAGLAGALLVVGVRHQLVSNISAGYGFQGILIVLLTGSNGLLVAPIALFFAALGIGGAILPIRLQLDSSLGGVFLGTIVLLFELVQGIRQKRAENKGIRD